MADVRRRGQGQVIGLRLPWVMVPGMELFDLSTTEMLAGLEGDKLDVALSVEELRKAAAASI